MLPTRVRRARERAEEEKEAKRAKEEAEARAAEEKEAALRSVSLLQ